MPNSEKFMLFIENDTNRIDVLNLSGYDIKGRVVVIHDNDVVYDNDFIFINEEIRYFIVPDKFCHHDKVKVEVYKIETILNEGDEWGEDSKEIYTKICEKSWDLSEKKKEYEKKMEQLIKEKELKKKMDSVWGKWTRSYDEYEKKSTYLYNPYTFDK